MRSFIVGIVLALLGIVAAQASVPAAAVQPAQVSFAAPAGGGIRVAMEDMKGKGKMDKGKMGKHHKRHHKHHHKHHHMMHKGK